MIKIKKIINLPSVKKTNKLFSKKMYWEDFWTNCPICDTDEELKKWAKTQYTEKEIILNLDSILYLYEGENCFNMFIVAQLKNNERCYFYDNVKNRKLLKM